MKPDFLPVHIRKGSTAPLTLLCNFISVILQVPRYCFHVSCSPAVQFLNDRDAGLHELSLMGVTRLPRSEDQEVRVHTSTDFFFSLQSSGFMQQTEGDSGLIPAIESQQIY